MGTPPKRFISSKYKKALIKYISPLILEGDWLEVHGTASIFSSMLFVTRMPA